MTVAPSEWKGANPFCLLIVGEDETVTLIDLDEPGWVTSHQDKMRAPGRWILARKAGSVPVLIVKVFDGEEAYYTSRVFHPIGSVPDCPVCGKSIDWQSIEYRAYGVGKKRLDGHTDRLWVLPNGAICGGDDVDHLGHEAIKVASNDMWRTHYGSHNQDANREGGEGEEGGRSGRRGRGQEGRGGRRAAGRDGSGHRRPTVRKSPRSRPQDSGTEQRAAS